MKIFNILYYLFITAIALIAILLLVSVFPITGNFKVLTVLSGSMEPSIRVGSIVVVKPASEYKVGDVITFGKISKTQTPTTHRISEIKNPGATQTFVTKGDTNNAVDAREVRQSEIVGKVLFSAPYLGYAISTAKKPYGFALIIIIPALLVIFDEGKKIKDEVKRIKQAKLNESEQPKT
ncbi:MAG: signal peptidase I [Candidatus Gracilibacteria bacterium]